MVKTYPAVLLVATHGRAIAVAAAVLTALLALAVAMAGGGIVSAIVGVLLAGLVWAGLRLLGELVEVVAETLLPR